MRNNSSKLVHLLQGCDGGIPSSIPINQSILMATAMFFITLMAILGNTLVLFAAYRYKTLRTTTYAMFCSMAISDFLSPLLRIFPVAIGLLQQRWAFGCTFCQVSAAFGVLFPSSSILHLCAITLERFVTVKYPYTHAAILKKRRIVALFVFIWMLSVFMVFVPHISSDIKLWFNTNLSLCEFYLNEEPNNSLLLALLYFGLPFTIMVIVNNYLYRVARVSTRRLSVTSATGRSRTKSNKSIKVVTVVVGVFFVLWSPFFVVKVIRSYKHDIVPDWLERFSFVLVYMNSACNWIIYGIMNKKIRKAFTKIIKGTNRTLSKRFSRDFASSVTSIFQRFFVGVGEGGEVVGGRNTGVGDGNTIIGGRCRVQVHCACATPESGEENENDNGNGKDAAAHQAEESQLDNKCPKSEGNINHNYNVIQT